MTDRGLPYDNHIETLDRRAPELEAMLSPKAWEWLAIGDNTLAAWSWAERIEAEEGIPHQAALRYVRDRYVPAGTR